MCKWFMSYVILIDNDYQSILFVLSHIALLNDTLVNSRKNLCSPQSAGAADWAWYMIGVRFIACVRACVREYRIYKQQHAVTVQLIKSDERALCRLANGWLGPSSSLCEAQITHTHTLCRSTRAEIYSEWLDCWVLVNRWSSNKPTDSPT